MPLRFGVTDPGRVVVGHASGHAVVVALAALEARRSGRGIQTVEIGCIGDRRGDEFGYLAGGALRGPDAVQCANLRMLVPTATQYVKRTPLISPQAGH